MGRGQPEAVSSLPARLARRLERLPTVRVNGRLVRLAAGPSARALGLAFLDRRSAGSGLLIPGCRSVHTLGMRFSLDIAFLDAEGAVLSRRLGVGPRRIVCDRRASAVLEVPAREAPE
jgi:uncharacterized membrane protein (UPF0127 family)